MNTEVDGCEGEVRVTLALPNQSWRTNPPNHARSELGLNINLSPRPILAFVDIKHGKDAHNPHP